MIKFSILIPAYKAQFLGKCIESVLAQTYTNFEVIIVNDASPQDLYTIVKLYNDERIKYYCNEVGFGAYNVVDNWNKCLEYASGDFVICMGDDDMLLPECLEKYVYIIRKYPLLDVYHARTILIDENDKYVGVVHSRAEFESKLEFMRHRMDGYLQFIGDFCFRTTALIECGGFIKKPLAWGSDDLTVYKMIGEKGIANIANASFLYRINMNSISSDSNVEVKLLSNVDTIDWIKNDLKNMACKSAEDRLTKDAILNNLSGWLISLQEYPLMQLKGDIGVLLRILFCHRKYGIPFKLVLKRLFSPLI